MHSAHRISELEQELADERLHCEVLVSRVAELEKQNRRLDEITHIVAHDLREPLRSVTVMLQILARTAGGSLDAPGHQLMSQALKGAARMDRMISDLLAYARTGQIRRLEAFAVSEAVSTAMEHLTFAIEDNEAQVVCGRLPVIGGADPQQLVQLFQNLISNALKYRSASPPYIEISAEEQHGHWMFSVRDNGIGFDQEHAEVAFQPLRQLHGNRDGSTGMGLAICSRIVEGHGGRMWAESTPGRGSTFFFTLANSATCAPVVRAMA
jgi:light-regulated signal transduction histidine kinase (bacteriophytochrome)